MTKIGISVEDFDREEKERSNTVVVGMSDQNIKDKPQRVGSSNSGLETMETMPSPCTSKTHQQKLAEERRRHNMFIMSETDSRVNLYQMQLDDVEVEQQKVL